MIGGQKGYAGDYGPAIEAWLDAPGGIAVAPNGDIYFADSNNHVIRRVDARNNIDDRSPATTTSAPASRATTARRPTAQLDTPDGVAIAPDGDLIVADSHNDRIRRVDQPTGDHHDDRRLGRERLRRRRQAGDRGGAQHAERRRRGAQRRHLHRRHAELPRPDDRRARPA